MLVCAARLRPGRRRLVAGSRCSGQRTGRRRFSALRARDRAARNADRARDEGQGAAGACRSRWSTISGSCGQGLRLRRSREEEPATAETVYRVGSVSKLFTDIAVMQLVERGQVDLDAPGHHVSADVQAGESVRHADHPAPADVAPRRPRARAAGRPLLRRHGANARRDRRVAQSHHARLRAGDAHQILQRRHRRRRPRAGSRREAAVRRRAARSRAGAAGTAERARSNRRPR